MKENTTKTCARFSTYPDFGNVALLHAAYKKHSFSPHFHEGHVIGVIEKGNLGFDYKGEKVVAGSGEINIADPGEIHNGFPVSDQGWQYRMFYFEPAQLERMLNAMCGRKTHVPVFKKGVVKDKAFAALLCRLHKDFENPRISLLEKESRFRTLFSSFILKHACADIPVKKVGLESKLVKQAKAYMASLYETNIRLVDLAAHAGVSRYYFLRVFAKQTGMTPHAWLNHFRVQKARELMQKKISIIDTALLTGFYDQSHLNRVFKKITGITPGQYAQAL